MKRKVEIIFCICFLALISGASAQKYSFEYAGNEYGEVRQQVEVKSHFLGDEFATQMQLLKEMYTYEEEDEISKTVSTVVEKSSIYNSVRKINKYLKKALKSGDLTEEQAKAQLTKTLQVALNIRYQETSELESELWKTKKPEAIADLFTKIDLGI